MVIHGEVLQDEPDAADLWMPSGACRMQPAGEVHITTARGEHSVAFIEIAQGPGLFRLTDEAAETDKRPVSIDSGNLAWLDSPAPPMAGGGLKARCWPTEAGHAR